MCSCSGEGFSCSRFLIVSSTTTRFDRENHESHIPQKIHQTLINEINTQKFKFSLQTTKIKKEASAKLTIIDYRKDTLTINKYLYFLHSLDLQQFPFFKGSRLHVCSLST